MSHYKSNLRDIEFNLYEIYDLENLLDREEFAAFDRPTADQILEELRRLATEDMAASFADADRHPPVLDNGNVTLPDSLKASLAAYYEGGWHMLAVPPRLGGMGAPALLRWAGQEMLVGANPAAFFYIIGGMMAVVLAEVGTEEQAETWARPILERTWGATMVLTEPDAGSDVGAGTTKAVPVDDAAGVYHLEGVKRFITSGASDYHENIIHFVLARPPGAEAGTKGLSMFIVPHRHINDDGSVGERNGVTVTRLEDKMGIKASTTCELTLGGDVPCVGYLVGGVHDGIRQMFHIIEDARMLIGTKSMATLSTGYLNALAFAGERVQSADLTQAADKTAPRVEIIRHPDVRRLLMLQKAHVEGMRALLFHTAWTLDQAKLDPDDEHWHSLSALLLPMLKGYNSEKAYELLGQSLQVFGGSGFTKDYPLEQYIRDVKIDSLYEGTTAIQSLDLFFRKIVKDRAETVMRLGEEVLHLVKGGTDAFEDERQLLGGALDDVQAQVGVMVQWLGASEERPEAIYRIGLHANALLESLAEVTMAWLLLRQAHVADEALPHASETDVNFYQGKIAAARFFVRHTAPKVTMRRHAAEAENGSLMDLPDAAF